MVDFKRELVSLIKKYGEILQSILGNIALIKFDYNKKLLLGRCLSEAKYFYDIFLVKLQHYCEAEPILVFTGRDLHSLHLTIHHIEIDGLSTL